MVPSFFLGAPDEATAMLSGVRRALSWALSWPQVQCCCDRAARLAGSGGRDSSTPGHSFPSPPLTAASAVSCHCHSGLPREQCQGCSKVWHGNCLHGTEKADSLAFLTDKQPCSSEPSIVSSWEVNTCKSKPSSAGEDYGFQDPITNAQEQCTLCVQSPGAPPPQTIFCACVHEVAMTGMAPRCPSHQLVHWHL